MADIALVGVAGVTTSRESAFARFYQGNIYALSRTLAVSLNDSELGHEAAQEAMARACERWDTVADYDNPAGWCYRVAMNWATSRWRKRRREVITDDPPLPVVKVEQPDVEIRDRLREALATLSVDHRSVIVLRLIEDWSIAETATALGIAHGTVQSRYARALDRLRAELGDLDE